MSWSFEFVAENKAAAIAQVRANVQPNQMPQSVADLLIPSIEEQRDDVAIRVKCNGHIGGSYGHNCSFEVAGISLVREPENGAA